MLYFVTGLVGAIALKGTYMFVRAGAAPLKHEGFIFWLTLASWVWVLGVITQ